MRIQMSKSTNHNTANSNYLSMNSFNNNNKLMIQNGNGNDDANMETTDNLLLQSTTNSSQRWNASSARNGNGQRTQLSWHVRICTNNNINCGARGDLSLNLGKVANQTSDDTDNNGKNNCPSSPFDCEARYRKTWI